MRNLLLIIAIVGVMGSFAFVGILGVAGWDWTGQVTVPGTTIEIELQSQLVGGLWRGTITTPWVSVGGSFDPLRPLRRGDVPSFTLSGRPVN